MRKSYNISIDIFQILSAGFNGAVACFVSLMLQADFYDVYEGNFLEEGNYSVEFLVWFFGNFLIGAVAVTITNQFSLTHLESSRWYRIGWDTVLSGACYGVLLNSVILLGYINDTQPIVGIYIGFGIVVIAGALLLTLLVSFLLTASHLIYLKLEKFNRLSNIRWFSQIQDIGRYINRRFFFADFPELQIFLVWFTGFFILFVPLALISGRFGQNKLLVSFAELTLYVVLGYTLIAILIPYNKLEERRREREEKTRLEYVGLWTTFAVHQLSQPIGIIRIGASGLQSMLRKGNLSIDEINFPLEAIMRQTDRMANIVKQVTNIANEEVHSGKAIQLNTIIEEVGRQFQEQLAQNDIQLHIDSDKPITVTTDQFLLREVLTNLLQNASDALTGQEKAEIWIRAFANQQSVRVTIEDNGPGVAENYEKQLFVPFTSTKSTSNGTGLGLYTSQQILQKIMNGNLSYQARDGGGAKFIVELPTS